MSANKRTDEPAGAAASGRGPQPSRRSVLQGAAGLAGAGLAASAMAGTLAAPAAASASSSPRANRGQAARAASAGEPVIVHVRDVRSGEMDVFAGTSRTRLHDPGLAAKLVHAAG
jgi:hypothetical protein